MSATLNIQTDCEDISEFIQSFSERAEESQLILYGSNAFETGEQISFAINLSDQTTALEGQGTVVASIDGGEDREPETRFDIILTNLNLSGSHEIIYEQMVNDSSDTESVAPHSSEEESSSLDESQSADASSTVNEWTSKPLDELPAPTSISLNFETPDQITLSRPQIQTAWEPTPPKRNTIQPASGLFQYEGDLPIPEKIPLPNQMNIGQNNVQEAIEELEVEEVEELEEEPNAETNNGNEFDESPKE